MYIHLQVLDRLVSTRIQRQMFCALLVVAEEGQHMVEAEEREDTYNHH